MPSSVKTSAMWTAINEWRQYRSVNPKIRRKPVGYKCHFALLIIRVTLDTLWWIHMAPDHFPPPPPPAAMDPNWPTSWDGSLRAAKNPAEEVIPHLIRFPRNRFVVWLLWNFCGGNKIATKNTGEILFSNYADDLCFLNLMSPIELFSSLGKSFNQITALLLGYIQYKNFYGLLLSNKSFASLILAARYGEPPEKCKTLSV